jgi:hypothetical protein
LLGYLYMLTPKQMLFLLMFNAVISVVDCTLNIRFLLFVRNNRLENDYLFW